MAQMGMSMMLALVFGVIGAGCKTVSRNPVGADSDAEGVGSDTVRDPDAVSEGSFDTVSDADSDVDSDSDGEWGFDTWYVEKAWNTDAYRDTATNTNPEDAGIPDGSYPDASWDADDFCPDWELELEVNPSRIVVLHDISDSMGQGTPTRWEQAQSALVSLLGTFGSSDLLAFGFDVFPDRGNCFAGDPVVIDSAPNNGRHIFDLLPFLELSQGTPLFMAMGNFLDARYAPVFTDKAHPSYLIIVSDGRDTCGHEAGHLPDDPYGAGAVELGTRARELLDDKEIFTMAIGFGDEVDPEQLDAIAQNGGTDYDQYIQVDDRMELEAALHELAAYTTNCELDVNIVWPEPQDDPGYEVDTSEIEFFLEGNLIPRDPGCADGVGWDWIIEQERLVFCPEVCTYLRENDASGLAMECTGMPYIVPIQLPTSEKGTGAE